MAESVARKPGRARGKNSRNFQEAFLNPWMRKAVVVFLRETASGK